MSEDQLEVVLKAAYRYASGDMSIGTEELKHLVMSELCNLIGDEAFCDFVEYELCV